MKTPNLRNEKGVAMMMALITFMVLSVLIGELAYESGVYSGVVWKQVDQVRATLLARSALRMSILQIKAAEKAKEKVKTLGLGSVGDGLTDQIWKTPLILPPPSPPGLSEVDKEGLAKFEKSLGLGGTISSSIVGENGRLNLNQLVWVKEKAPTGDGGAGEKKGEKIGEEGVMNPEKRKELQEANKRSYAQIIEQILQNERQTNNSFRDSYATVTGESLVGNLMAWMSPDVKTDGDNRDKGEYYARLEPNRYSIKNAPLWSESELHMIKGFDDTLSSLIGNNFTVQPTGGVNVNDASPTLLRGLIPELGDAEVEKVLKRRSTESEGGAFKDAKDFWEFLNTLGDYSGAKKRLEDAGIAILEKETSYRITINAQSGSVKKSWTALVGPQPPQVDAPDPNQPKTDKPAVGIESSEEDIKKDQEKKKQESSDANTLNIIYLKAD